MGQRRRGFGFGFVMLLVVLAVVLLLAARGWERVMAPAVQVSQPDPVRGEAVDALGELPDLDAMRQATDAHGERLQQALEESE